MSLCRRLEVRQIYTSERPNLTPVCRRDRQDHGGGGRTVRESSMGRVTDLCHQTPVPAEYLARRKYMDSFVGGMMEI